MTYRNGIITTTGFYQVINTELESLGIKSESDEQLLKLSFFFDQLTHYYEEDNDCTGISFVNGFKVIIPYSFDDFNAFIIEIASSN